ncbi:MAG: DUF4159 domain-containing protein [Gemmatimonadetes bacterium]|nr:DUF4159 domain-containing protein [Gemmatimonadota bacterium]MDE3259480.1 DUF4159 domain-containing protein [Gemmatimonadota bacterium]
MDTEAKHKDSAGRYARKGVSCALFCLLTVGAAHCPAQLLDPPASFTMARLKFGGGGDWYNGPTEVPNLLAFIRSRTTIHTAEREARVEIMDEDLFAYPVLYLTGHGNIRFTEDEVVRLRAYLEHGGFLFANDDYGLDKAFRRELARTFPDKELVELPPSFGIFQHPFPFPDGLPKIHEHDGRRPQAFGIFHEGRLVVFYNYECDLGDGWNDAAVHNDPPEKRDAALKMGTNVVVWALTH